jgi:hypothetical protein
VLIGVTISEKSLTVTAQLLRSPFQAWLGRNRMTSMLTPNPQPRWYHLTPDRFVFGLLAVEVFLLLSEGGQWFAFNENKGWTVLIGLAVLGLAILVLFVWFGLSLVLRRGFRFGLRTLLLFVVVCAIVGSLFSVEVHQARREQQAVAELAKSASRWGNFVRREDGGLPQRWFGDRFAPVVGLHLGDSIEDGGLIHLKGLPQLRTLYFDESNVTDADLVHLAHVPQLQKLSLRDTNITDAGLVQLRGLPQLQTLDLWQTEVSDAGLVHLGRLRQLRTLNLGYTEITDGGLGHLTELSQLETLHIEGTAVTDAGLVHLKKLTQLRTLYHCHPNNTYKKLREALPNCQIISVPMPEEWGDSRRSRGERRW